MTSTALPPQNQLDTGERLKEAVRANLVLETPPDLAARLLTLTQQPAPGRLDQAVRAAVLVEPPVELQKRLQSLAPTATPALMPVTSTRRWIGAVYAATAIMVGVLLVLGAQLYSQALDQVGTSILWTQISAVPGNLLARLYEVLPQTAVVIDFYQALQGPLYWLLLGLVLWAVLDMRSSQRAQQRA